MAIYTQYGRYIKAKMFKEMLETTGDTYMAFGLGNPFWDKFEPENSDNSKNQKMPNAPYDDLITDLFSSSNNSFIDDTAYQIFAPSNSETTGFDKTQYEYVNAGSNDDSNTISRPFKLKTQGSKSEAPIFGEYLKNVLPKFPCLWKPDDSNPVTIYEFTNINDSSEPIKITQNNYDDYYLTMNENGKFSLHRYGDDKILASGFDIPDDIEKRQFFAEMYLRGVSYTRNRRHPLGLLGVAKCSITFVKDIGNDPDAYTGKDTQFWYGDRYWEKVYPSDDMFKDLLLNSNKKSDNNDDMIAKDNIFPHHLYISTLLVPTTMNPIRKIDFNIVPRQIAIYHKPRIDLSTYLPDTKFYNDIFIDARGDNSLRISDDYYFNFGQYNDNELKDIYDDIVKDIDDELNKGTDKYNVATSLGLDEDAFSDYITNHSDDRLAIAKKIANRKILQFIPSYNPTINGKSSYGTIGTKFNFILHDYIHGHIRSDHDMESIGYIIGF